MPDRVCLPGSHFDFLTGGGEMGARIRAYDWSSSVLGPPDNWPQSLRVIIRLILNSRQPMLICNEVTSQHLAQEALKDKTQYLTRLFAQAPGYMAVLRGPNHVFELTNAAYVNLIGDRDFIGKPLRDVIPEVVAQGALELLDD